MTPQEELEKIASDWFVAHFFKNLDDYDSPRELSDIKAFKAGFLALQEILQKVVDSQRQHWNNLYPSGIAPAMESMASYACSLESMLSSLHTEIEKWKEVK